MEAKSALSGQPNRESRMYEPPWTERAEHETSPCFASSS